MTVLAKRIRSLNDIQELFAATQGQVPVKQSDGTWSPANAVGGTGTVNAKDNGILGDGVTDETVAIQALVNANAGNAIYFPSGKYLVSTAIDVPAGTIIVGDRGRSGVAPPALHGTVFLQSNAVHAFFVLHSHTAIHGITTDIAAGAIPTSGSAILITCAQEVLVSNVDIVRCWDGITVTSPGAMTNCTTITDFSVREFKNVALDFQGSVGSTQTGNVCNGIIFGQSTGELQKVGTCIKIRDFVDGFNFVNIIMVYGEYGLDTDSASFTNGQCPGHVWFTNCQFDMNWHGNRVNNLIMSQFDNCWLGGAGGNYGSALGNGVTVGVCEQVAFNNCQFGENRAHGAFVSSAGSKWVTFLGCTFMNNGQWAPAHGVVFAAGVSDFRVQSCTATGLGMKGGAQAYGICVTAGASDRYIIADNLVTGNSANGVVDDGTGVNKRVANNY